MIERRGFRRRQRSATLGEAVTNVRINLGAFRHVCRSLEAPRPLLVHLGARCHAINCHKEDFARTDDTHDAVNVGGDGCEHCFETFWGWPVFWVDARVNDAVDGGKGGGGGRGAQSAMRKETIKQLRTRSCRGKGCRTRLCSDSGLKSLRGDARAHRTDHRRRASPRRHLEYTLNISLTASGKRREPPFNKLKKY